MYVWLRVCGECHFFTFQYALLQHKFVVVNEAKDHSNNNKNIIGAFFTQIQRDLYVLQEKEKEKGKSATVQ